MRQSVWNKKIPGLSLLLFLGIGIAVTFSLAQSGGILTGRAAPGNEPQTIKVTNITDTSFTVAYTTTEQVLGSVQYGTTPEGQELILDDRDQKSSSPKPYYTHHITIPNLKPNTQYFYKIISGDGTFLNNSAPYTATTAQTITGDSQNQIPISGSLLLSDGLVASDGLIFVEGEDSQILSGFTTADGTYTIPLRFMRARDMNTYAQLTDTSTLQLSLYGFGGTSQISVLASQASQVPPATLTQNYDFADSTDQTLTPSPIDDSEKLPAPEDQGTASKQLTITNPSEAERFSDSRPVFSGSSFSNTDVDITISTPETIQTTVATSTSGKWSYRPANAISPGTYVLTVKSRDAAGVQQTLERNFSILTSGSNFTEPSISPVQATPTPTSAPSASPTRLPSITITPTAIPTVVTPTIAISPTIGATPGVTTILTPTLVPSVSPVPSLPPTGSVSYIISGVAALATFGIGILLFILI